MEIACPACGEEDALSGERSGDVIVLTCGSCGERWERDTAPSCPQCGGRRLRSVPLAIVEKGRGTQLSVVGTRPIQLCEDCDAESLERWHDNRPNPLMPEDLPTVSEG